MEEYAVWPFGGDNAVQLLQRIFCSEQLVTRLIATT